MKASLRSLSKPVHALPSCTNSIKHAFPPLSSPTGPLPHTPSTSYRRRQTDSLRLCWPRKHTDVHTQTPTQTSTSSHPTNSAVLSVPAWTAFTFAVLASAMFVAARVTRPLVTPSAHPAVFTAAAARHTNAMATTVRCTNLCGRQGHRKRRKKSVGEDRQKGRKGGGGGDGKGRQGGGWTRKQG